MDDACETLFDDAAAGGSTPSLVVVAASSTPSPAAVTGVHMHSCLIHVIIHRKSGIKGKRVLDLVHSLLICRFNVDDIF